MSTFDRLVIVANLVAVSGCIVVLVRAAVSDDVRLRPVWAAVAALAAVYAGGYVWLLATEDVMRWSGIFRGVSIVTWPLVWAVPALRSSRIHEQDVGFLDEIDRPS